MQLPAKGSTIVLRDSRSSICDCHWCKADVGTIGYLHPNKAACKAGYKFSSFDIHEILISCLIFTIT